MGQSVVVGNPFGATIDYADLGTDLQKYRLLETLDLTNAAQRTTSNLSAYSQVILEFDGATAQHDMTMGNGTAGTYERTYLTNASAIQNAAGLNSWGPGNSDCLMYFFQDGSTTNFEIIGKNTNANALWYGSCTGTLTTLTTSSTTGTLKVYVK